MAATMTLLRVGVIGTIWLGCLFVLFPGLSMRLNETLGWPRWQHPALEIAGWAIVLLGAGVLVWSLRVFRSEGGGTPVPTDPPTRLVRSGLFRFTRNPIFLADVAVVLGLFLARGHLALLLYAGVVFAGLHAWLRLHEEPLLEKRFGAEWLSYASTVPRWFGRPAARG